MRRILLTGAGGFIGSQLRSRYEDAYRFTPFSARNDDITNTDFANIDAVIHLAALVHQMNGAAEEAYQHANVDITVSLAKKAKTAGVPHFIFMSSVKVYGEESDRPYDETTPCHPSDAYGKSKLEAENALLELADDNFTVSIIRTPVVYGERVKGNIRSLLRLVDTLPALPLGGIENRRSMVYVGNLCALVDALINTPKGGVFLASDSHPFSTTTLIAEIANALGKKCFLFQPPLFAWLLKRLKPALHARLFGSLSVDAKKSNARLGFTPPYSSKEGVEAMVRWYKNAA